MLDWIDAFARETLLFAAAGLLVGGVDDLLVDLVFLLRRIGRAMPVVPIAALPLPVRRGPIAILVPAWDEAAVIGAMLRTALARIDHPDYRIRVGVYPNDPATIAQVQAVAAEDDRVRAVVGARDGPTTKADCLNTLWHALVREPGEPPRAIVLHDAEDVVHPDELTVYDALIDRHAVVQLPVLPLIGQGSLVAGHYADEFADAHARALVVRTFLRAGMPLAGTGCAIAPAMIERIAARRGGDPFDPASLVEDYELGLTIAALGGRGRFARVRAAGGELVAVRAFFPATIDAAVRQKARWMAGIAFAGWDRTGWGRPWALTENWMRMRDRRAPLAVLVLLAAYVALLAWGAGAAAHAWTGVPSPPLGHGMRTLLTINGALLAWRLAVRAWLTGRLYGLRQALWSAPRLVVGNYIALLAARRAMWRYLRMLAGAAPRWDKTRHDFPDLAPPR